ncbi:helix-turn-helix domain-containing protein [Kingella kingae]|uniref:helix-turn-helix domain-containing protein n=1 Tax=Kingella kingae TaxID=504 RepID=UPI00254AC15B|nr:helix-turn-helix transcriptional regulator [Kingella kingae]MDK4529848.1 helix-turn-helix transcriptional regulator [Kingella kingae]MDK4580783.1 helix-turn-helix transcriptional regulator [Kingella kingae]
MMNLQQIFTKRFKEARKAKKMTQEKLGLAIGLDEFVASTRINRYEKGNHQPDLNTLVWIAQILDVPPAYFFADDELVEIVLAHYRKQAV